MEYAAVVMAAASLATLYSSEQARGASAARLKELEQLYAKIKPPNYDLSIQDPPELHAQEVKKPEFSNPMTAPKFDQSKLRPEDMKLVGKYIPEIAPYVAEQAPQLVERSAGGKSALDAQMKALQKYTQISESGSDPIFEAQQAKAARQAQTEAQSRQASILQDFARRGQSGSGLSLAAQIGGTADAMDREAMAGQQSAADAYTRRLQALAAGSGLAGDIGRDDVSLQSRNAGIINDFNDRTSTRRQAWEQSRAGALSDAGRFNTTMAQNLSNANVEARNASAVRERNRGDELSKYGADFARGERDRIDANQKWGYGADVAQRNYGNDIAQARANWEKGQRDTHNKLLGQVYNDQLGQAGIKSGLSHQMDQQNIQSTQDRNSAISGLGQTFGSYASGQSAKDDNRYQGARADDRTQYEQTGKWMTPEERKKRYGDDPYADY